MKLNTRFAFIVLMIVLAASSRVLPLLLGLSLPNFTPIGSMALFGAAYFSRRWVAFALPLLTMFLSDLFLNNVLYKSWYPEFYQNFIWFAHPSVYFSFVLIGIIGFLALRNASKSPLRLGLTSLSSSVLFFLITNFAVWQGSTMYSQDVTGLLAAYVAGVPFFGNTVLGDLFYVTLLFGSFEFAQSRFKQLNVLKA